MNNEELKKKIVEVISQKQTYGIKEEFKTEDLGHGGWQAWTETTKVNNAEIADALIAAGIGDVKDLQAQVNVLEITNIALEAGYDDAEKDRLYWVDKYKEAEHRVEVVEHALRKFSVRIACKNCPFSEECNITPDRTNDYYDCFERYIKQAEKELAEERKDD